MHSFKIAQMKETDLSRKSRRVAIGNDETTPDTRVPVRRPVNTARVLVVLSTLGVALLFATYAATGEILKDKRRLMVHDNMVQNEVYTEELFTPSIIHSYGFSRQHKADATDEASLDRNFQRAPPLQRCQVPRHLIWEWKRYSMNRTTASKKKTANRLLVGVYYDTESFTGTEDDVQYQIHELTAQVNQAYARDWNVDFVTLSASETDGSCTSNQRMSLLRLRLLFYAADRDQQYDQLLLLDSNAMITDMDKDVTMLAKSDDVVLAPRIVPKDDEHTFRINPRIMLWNLRHPGTKVVAAEWFDAVLSPDSEINRLAPVKGRYLQYILRQYPEHVRALDDEFSGFADKSYVGRYYIDGHSAKAEKRVLARLNKDVRSVCKSHSTGCKIDSSSVA